ncbi:hypothetical protein HYALB_00000654 [Hymenoscyphus albidus]|uniref:Uncharacterized protein n=1 Tax=Hymenoscyphus albidus TaxID=595503 RepID=A0A9N9M2I4_9HELO|nr:hypothetical protein HYALB_00000654 [Hymenoscyphus albidus]
MIGPAPTTTAETKAAGAAPVVDPSDKSSPQLPLNICPDQTCPSPPFADWALRAAEGLYGYLRYVETTHEYEEMKRERGSHGMEYLWEDELHLMDDGFFMDTRWVKPHFTTR